MVNYDRMIENAMQEFQREVEQTVARKFARVLEQLQAGEEVGGIPVIDDAWAPSSLRTVEYFNEQQARVVRALCARKRFSYQAPVWAPPLPLTEQGCIDLLNQ